MRKIYSSELNEVWLKAAVMGSLWASFEIIIGSFLHNLRFPFAGTILSFASVGLIIAFMQVWKNKGLVWRAGLVAALLKSISPSAIILGPMIGIFTEALIIEVIVLILGRNLLGYIIGGALAVLSALLHKLVSLLVMYGFDLVIIVEELYQYISRQFGLSKGDPVVIISIVVMLYLLTGGLGAIGGYIGGNKARKISGSEQSKIIQEKSSSFFPDTVDKRSSPWLLLIHLICIIGCLYMINILPIWYSIMPSLAYAGYCLYAYRKSMRSFRKPSFWLWFMGITILAAIFWNGISTGNVWDWEGLIVGLRMNLRAVVILTGFAALSHELHNPIIRTVLYHHGFANVYHAVDLAFSVLPGMIESLPSIKKLMRSPVNSLGLIVQRSTAAYPSLKEELKNLIKVIILSGDIQEGKTTFLIRLIELLKQEGLTISGFTAPGVHEKGRRIGYDLEDIGTGQQMQFIRDVQSKGTFRHGKYFFNESGLEFGKELLSNTNTEEADLIVIDEVGPVEMKGKGWAEDIERLLSQVYVPQLWVVRNSLLKKAMRQWHTGDIMMLEIDHEMLDETVKEIKEFLQQTK